MMLPDVKKTCTVMVDSKTIDKKKMQEHDYNVLN